jgi:hypothetical protein
MHFYGSKKSLTIPGPKKQKKHKNTINGSTENTD